MRKYSREIYTKEVLLKSAYAFTDECYIHLDVEDDNYTVVLVGKDGTEQETFYLRFENELVAQETRRIVTEKTKNIREMIVARSLSSTIVNNEPEDDEDLEEFSVDDILIDWFKKDE